MRTGPHPLHMHLSMAASGMTGNPMRDSLLQKMVRGIQCYQAHEYAPERAAHDVVWESGKTVLYAVQQEQGGAHNADDDHAPVCVLVPSLVNRVNILDLNTEQSFALWLARHGVRVYLLDWGDLASEDAPPDLNALIQKRLIGALDYLCGKVKQKAHVLGYCMGGTLCVPGPLLRPDLVASLTLLAAPWDYAAGENSLQKRVQLWAASAMPVIEERGYLPAIWLQSLFASLDPATTLKKFTRFAELPEDSIEARIFIAVEDWLNDGADMPGAIAEYCIREWFIRNRLVSGGWVIDGVPIEPVEIQCPVLMIASEKDRLVDYASSMAFADGGVEVEYIKPDCGHIGMMAGRKCEAEVWAPFAKWVKRIERAAP